MYREVSALALFLILPLAVPSCALLPPTTAVALAAPARRPEGPGEHVIRNSEGQMLSRVEYWIDDRGHEIRHGTEASYWPDGQLKAQREFDKGAPVGHWQTFWKDGTARSDHDIKRGEATPMVYYHPNGEKAAQGLADAGQRTGAWNYWFRSGTLSEQGSYLEGKREGLWQVFASDGSLEEQIRYAAGKRIAK